LAGDKATVSGAEEVRSYQLSELRVTARIGWADRFVLLPDGGQLQCPDSSCLDRLANDSPTERHVAWLEERVGVAVGCTAIIVVLLVCAYLFGLPIAAKWAVSKVSMQTERSLGRDAFAWCEEKGWVKPSEVDDYRQTRIRKIFATLVAGSKLESYYRLEFRSSKKLGANAFAMPGGIIVLTDEMVWEAGSEDEIAAVLAHEIGHIELRHALKELMESSALAAVAGIVTSDASSYAVAVAGLPMLLAETKYSRASEAEADEFAFQLLKRRGISPAAFATLMERLAKDYPNRNGEYTFLSTHPAPADRAERARHASKPE
jgi:predicted Zn-dependent protease